MLGMPAFASADIAVLNATPVAFFAASAIPGGEGGGQKQSGTTEEASTAKEGKRTTQTERVSEQSIERVWPNPTHTNSVVVRPLEGALP